MQEMQGAKKVGGLQGLMIKNLEKYCEDLLKVLKRSLKLTFLSLDFGIDKGENFVKALPMMNHQFLTELCLNGDGKDEVHYATDFLDPHHIKSPNLSITHHIQIPYICLAPLIRAHQFLSSEAIVRSLHNQDLA